MHGRQGECPNCNVSLEKNLKVQNHYEYLGVKCIIILKWVLQNYEVSMCTKFIWFRTWYSDGLL